MRFSEILSYFNETSHTQSYKGRKFENIIASWFRTDPAYATQVKKVWTWSSFPGRKDAGQSGHDVGIDLVLKTFGGEFWAVQCKCYQKDSSVTLAMVSNFIAAGVTQFFDDEERTRPCNFSRLIFVNTGRMTATAKEAFAGKPFDYTFINSYQLEQSAVDWQKLLEGIEGGSARLNKKSPVNHQIRVVEKAREYFIEQNHERGKLNFYDINT